MLSISASLGFSKSGATWKVSTPVAAATENLALSAPPVILYVIVWAGRSSSVAVTVKADVWFSGTPAVPSEVITGGSLTSVAVTEMSWLSVPP